MKNFEYISYGGPEDYIFLRYHQKDAAKTITLANNLIEKEIRVYFDCADSKTEHTPTEISAAIKNAKLCVFVLSAEALEDLDFRNSINFAFTNRKKLICLRLTDKDLGHGMDMQLANIPMYRNEKDLMDAILNDEERELFTGEGQKRLEENKTRKILTVALLALSFILFIAAVFVIRNRISFYNSPAYQLSHLENTEYLDFTSYKQEDLVYLSGKTIDKLNFNGMNLTELKGLEDIRVRQIDIANNPRLSSIDAILASDTIQRVYLSQDMINYGDALLDKGIEVVING